MSFKTLSVLVLVLSSSTVFAARRGPVNLRHFCQDKNDGSTIVGELWTSQNGRTVVLNVTTPVKAAAWDWETLEPGIYDLKKSETIEQALQCHDEYPSVSVTMDKIENDGLAITINTACFMDPSVHEDKFELICK